MNFLKEYKISMAYQHRWRGRLTEYREQKQVGLMVSSHVEEKKGRLSGSCIPAIRAMKTQSIRTVIIAVLTT